MRDGSLPGITVSGETVCLSSAVSHALPIEIAKKERKRLTNLLGTWKERQIKKLEKSKVYGIDIRIHEKPGSKTPRYGLISLSCTYRGLEIATIDARQALCSTRYSKH